MNRIPNAKLRGFSLVELMVSLTIGIVLLLGLATLFVNNKQTFKETEQRGRLQENLRFGMQAVMDSLRTANYTGCRTTLDSSDVTGITGISGTNGSGENPDEVTITMISVTPIATYTPTASVKNKIEVDQPHSLNVNDKVILQNCASTLEVRTVTGIQTDSPSSGKDTLTLDQNPGYDTVAGVSSQARSYDGASVHTETSLKYHIKDNALWLGTSSSDGSALVGDTDGDRIENMQLLYGEDTNEDAIADSYKTADSVTDWDRIISVKVAMLFATEDYLGESASKSYQLLDKSITSNNDRRNRRVSTVTVMLRNQANRYP